MSAEHDRTLGVRLTLAAGAAVLLLVPFAVLALLVMTAWDPLRDLDVDLADRLHHGVAADAGLVTALQLWTDVLGPWPLRTAVGCVAVWLWLRGARRVAIWAVVTVVAGGLLGVGLKLLFGRDRPEFLRPVSEAAGYAFPSGHAMTAALVPAVLLLMSLPFTSRPAVKWAMVAAAVVVAVGTGLTRIALGVHWFSDVVAGWALGLAVVAATTAAFTTSRGDSNAFEEAAHQIEE